MTYERQEVTDAVGSGKKWRLQMTDKAEIMELLALANELLNKLKEIEALGGTLGVTFPAQ